MADVTYTREAHAAHDMFSGKVLHDLECWDCVLPTYNAPRPCGVPSDAERDFGYVRDGVQHVVFRRRAPATGHCSSCKEYRRHV